MDYNPPGSLSMESPRQEYWSGLMFLPDPGIELTSLVSPALAGGFFTTSTTWEAHDFHSTMSKKLVWGNILD